MIFKYIGNSNSDLLNYQYGNIDLINPSYDTWCYLKNSNPFHPYPTAYGSNQNLLDYNNAQFLNDVISPDIFNSSDALQMINSAALPSNLHSKQKYSQNQPDDIVRVNNHLIFSNTLGSSNNSVATTDKKMSNEEWQAELSAKDKRRLF